MDAMRMFARRSRELIEESSLCNHVTILLKMFESEKSGNKPAANKENQSSQGEVR